MKLIDACREVMNENSRDYDCLPAYLDILRRRVGLQLYRLKHEYGCTYSGPISEIVHP